jgi:hypothetical protein
MKLGLEAGIGDGSKSENGFRVWDATSKGELRARSATADLPGFEETENPFPWMSEAMDLKKEKNFFETRVIEYQNGGALTWD